MRAHVFEEIELSYEGESARLATLADLDILDTPPEDEFDTIVECAQRSFGCKIALLSIVDEHRQWFKAKCGLNASETPRGQAFCAHVIEQKEMLVVPDATKDPRFSDNPLVLGAPHVRFYAGMPLRVHGGRTDGRSFAMGTLCIIDDKPRQLSDEDAAALRKMAKLAESLLNARAALALSMKATDEHRSLLQKVDLTHWQFRQAERMANIGSWRLTFADNHTEWSDQVYAIHGLPRGSSPPLDAALRFYPPHARAIVAAALERTMASGEPFDIETDFLTAQGDSRRVRTMGEIELRNGLPHAIVGVFQDVTIRHLMEQALRRSASTDDLTQLANRAHFNDMLDEKLAAARTMGQPLAVLLIDLDHFKAVNDRRGHLAGDDLLRAVASKLKAPYLAQSVAARLGGDEFVLIVTDPDLLADLPRLLRKVLADLRLPIGDKPDLIPVSATIGAVRLAADISDRSEMLHRADIALYKAKQFQRGTAAIFNVDDVIVADEAIEILDDGFRDCPGLPRTS